MGKVSGCTACGVHTGADVNHADPLNRPRHSWHPLLAGGDNPFDVYTLNSFAHVPWLPNLSPGMYLLPGKLLSSPCFKWCGCQRDNPGVWTPSLPAWVLQEIHRLEGKRVWFQQSRKMPAIFLKNRGKWGGEQQWPRAGGGRESLRVRVRERVRQKE